MWADDRDRCRAAGIGDDVEFATKPQQAQAMIARTIDGRMPFRWLTANETHGQVRYLRVWLESRDVIHVLATKRNDTVPAGAVLDARIYELIAALPPDQRR